MYKERLDCIQSLEPILKMEKIDTARALHRVLLEDVYAECAMPPFDKSAMDGYACRMTDIGNPLTLLETIPAGHVPTKSLGENECSKIMTGAALPEHADCVFKVEDATVLPDGRVQCTDPQTRRNICYLGEDYRKGDRLLATGQILGPEHLAVLSATGLKDVTVSKLPRIALIITGSELVEPGEVLAQGKIRNSNGNQLIGLLHKMAYPVAYLGLVQDDYEILRDKVLTTLEEYDVLILTGGASMGDFDHIPALLKNEGFTLYWERTGLKPGNPMTFARKGDRYFLGLSGNPVSSLVQFEFLAKAILYQLTGARYRPFRFKAVLAEDLVRDQAGRLAVVPVKLNDEGAFIKVAFNGSAHISGLAYGSALLEMPVGIKEIKKGELAYVRPL